jgi:RNA polymerase sigma-70 factor (ECF subfamily)
MNPAMAAGTLSTRALPPGERADAGCAPVPSLAEVYQTHFSYVWRCLRGLGVRDASLDDALQDVFVVVQKKLPGFDGRAELRTWLYAIALRIARKYRARSQREVAPLCDADNVSEPRAQQTDAEGVAQSGERLQLARAALDALDDEKREVFVLARVEQMSAPEIASVIGIPLNTVYSRLRAARQAFEAEVERLQARSRRSP